MFDLIKPMDRYVIQAAHKTLQVLLVFARPPHRFALAEVVERTGMEKNQVFRALKTLEHSGFLRAEPDGRLALTALVSTLAAGRGQPGAASLPRVAAAHMERLFEQTDETVGLYSYDGEQAVLIDALESSRSVRWSMAIGKHFFLHAGAAPKAILAHLEPKPQQEYLARLPGLPRYTPRTITSPERMRQEIETTLERGYMISDGEFDGETRSVGGPLFGRAGRVVGAIAVGGPASRVTDEKLQRFGLMVSQTAALVSAELGFFQP